MPLARSRRSSSASCSLCCSRAAARVRRSGSAPARSRRAALHGERHQLLLGAVVDVALDPPSLTVLGRHQALPRRPELLEVGTKLLGQPHVPQHQPGLRGQVVDELVLRRGERIVRRFRHRERAEQLVAVADGGDLRGVAERRELAVGHRQSAVAGAASPHDAEGRSSAPTRSHTVASRAPVLCPAARHPRQDVFERVGLADTLGELREHLVGRGAFAVHQPVREPVRAIADGIEGHRDRRGGEHREERVAGRADRRADPHDDRQVDGGEERRQQRVDDRLADDDVEVVQAVLQDRDAAGHRHGDAEPEHDDRLERSLPAAEADGEGRRSQDHRRCR